MSSYCEAGELDPSTGLLRIWVGKSGAVGCPKASGKPTYTAVRVGK